MKPSVFGSFLSFLITGFLTMYSLDLSTDLIVKHLLYFAMFSCGIYYYYLNAAIENKRQVSTPIKKKKITWGITVFQYICFLSIWELLEIDLTYYALGLLLINTSYLLWDLIHSSHIKRETLSRNILIIDIVGFVLSFFLMIVTWGLPPERIDNPDGAHHAIYIGLICTVLIIQSAVGIIIMYNLLKYNPFKID